MHATRCMHAFDDAFIKFSRVRIRRFIVRTYSYNNAAATYRRSWILDLDLLRVRVYDLIVRSNQEKHDVRRVQRNSQRLKCYYRHHGIVAARRNSFCTLVRLLLSQEFGTGNQREEFSGSFRSALSWWCVKLSCVYCYVWCSRSLPMFSLSRIFCSAHFLSPEYFYNE